ncbi:MAG TPA: tetratricopeptide repeat protein, partial [Bacteroidia bacterium]|nr:tetratricopeptide repeat protein [Bacteroidia bacterium]
AKKAELEKAAKEKAAADKLAKEKAAAAKVETDKAAKEKQAADKLAKQKETEANKIAKEKEPVAKKIEPKKTEAEKITKQRTTEDDKNKPKPGKPKTEPIIGGKKTTPHEDDEMSLTGDKKHQVRHELGPNAYKNAIVRANDLFKMKRYEEARSFYEKALEAKPGDALATDRLEKIKKLLEGK